MPPTQTSCPTWNFVTSDPNSITSPTTIEAKRGNSVQRKQHKIDEVLYINCEVNDVLFCRLVCACKICFYYFSQSHWLMYS